MCVRVCIGCQSLSKSSGACVCVIHHCHHRHRHSCQHSLIHSLTAQTQRIVTASDGSSHTRDVLSMLHKHTHTHAHDDDDDDDDGDDDDDDDDRHERPTHTQWDRSCVTLSACDDERLCVNVNVKHLHVMTSSTLIRVCVDLFQPFANRTRVSVSESESESESEIMTSMTKQQK